mmetsp:Transcript_22017/g.30587  ORF Transcript_22017/g.30587 Transcript_22017/m.30587 type:complete len:114 (-) Transcript_22017:185-526(-)|eukprot:CAMPEP_0196571000 /NCGR_PEP_ID=MMETSP1081-20130531/1174_1 /TAXON_ID=36882 /ORGANISM="Pyramimonas amylifera, Strain CCMP720" /LENGTH=113 /DNA_ID=CAMNT_0041887741 /DNA_START=136 /DNA_END=477 /DNA_ORIENTATION=+
MSSMAALSVSSISLSSVTRNSASFQTRRSLVAKRGAFTTVCAGKKKSSLDMDIMEWFNGLMVKDSDALAAGYETTIKTDAFKKGASAKAAAPTPSPKKKVVKKAGFSLPFGKK